MCTIVQIVNSQKNIYKKVTPIWPLLPAQTGSQSWISKKNNISTTARGKFTIFAPLYRSLIVKKYLQKSDPNLTFTSWPNRKSKFTITKNHISTTARGKFTIVCTIVQIVNCQKNIYKKVTPIWPLLPVQTGSQSLIFKTNHVSTTARGTFPIFALLYRSLILQKIFTKRWPQLDLYFLSKPEVKV